MHKRYLPAALVLMTFAFPGAALAQVPPVGPGKCVANCAPPPSGGIGAPRGGGSGGTNAVNSAIGLGGAFMQVIQSTSQATTTAVQSQIQNVRDKVQRRKKKDGRPLG